MFGVNAAGIKCKLDSFNDILNRVKPQIWSVQETKLRKNENLKCDAVKKYQVFYLYRENSQGGGLAIGVDKDIESTLVREGNDEVEALVVQVVLGKISVRLIVAYGPQENALKEKKEHFWEFIEEEAVTAELQGHGLIIQMDGNLHAGPELIKTDPNLQNQNGKLFMQFLDKNPFLVVANKLNICEGVITRQRDVLGKTEKAILDFFIMNELMRPFLSKMIIDEERIFCLSNFAQYKKNKRVVETDHNLMIAEFDISVPKRKPERVEIYNLRNRICQEAFTKETEENKELLECLETSLPFENQCRKWLKTFNNTLYKCFKKVRIVNNERKKDANAELLQERVDLKKEEKANEISEEMRIKIEERIVQIEDEIGTEVSENYVKEIYDTLHELGGDGQHLKGSDRKKMWEILKRKYPKILPAVPVGKKDKAGNIITNHEGLKDLYLKTYKHRLRNRPMKDELQEMKSYKDDLFELKLSLASSNKSLPWTMEDLEFVLKHLKEENFHVEVV